jgi:hypothetical protein
MLYLLLENQRMEWITKLCAKLKLYLSWFQQYFIPPLSTTHKLTSGIMEEGQVFTLKPGSNKPQPLYTQEFLSVFLYISEIVQPSIRTLGSL